MKIGVFDSGLGGLLITHGLINNLPEYDYLYLGDTARVPYGNRPQSEIYEFTRDAVDYLFGENCGLIIIACNTASAEALHRIQVEYLPKHYPNRRVLGVLVPAVETALMQTKTGSIGVLATQSTVSSHAFDREIAKQSKQVTLKSNAAPSLVPMIEAGELSNVDTALTEYLKPLVAAQIDTLILGCTHYPYLKSEITKHLGQKVQIICQNEILPDKLRDYLTRHPEIDNTLTRQHLRTFQVTSLSDALASTAAKLFGEPVKLDLIPDFVLQAR